MSAPPPVTKVAQVGFDVRTRGRGLVEVGERLREALQPIGIVTFVGS